MLVSRGYSASSNSKRENVRCNYFSKTEPSSLGSTKPITLIAKWSNSNSTLETPLRNLEATPLI